MPRFMKSLNNISRAQAIFRRDSLPGDLSPNMHSFVLAICRAPGSTQDEIGKDVCISKSVVSRRIEWLCDNGYATSETDPGDKRCQRIYPTERMLELLPEVRRISREWMQMLTEDISDGELEIFEAVLSRLETRAREVVRL